MSYAITRKKVSRKSASYPVLKAIETLNKITADFGILEHDSVQGLESKTSKNLQETSLLLIAACKSYCSTKVTSQLRNIENHLETIENSQTCDGFFIARSSQNSKIKSIIALQEVQGYIIWSLGYLSAMKDNLPAEILQRAETILLKAILNIESVNNPPALSLMIKGLYFYNTSQNSLAVSSLIKTLSDRLSQMFLYQSTKNWQWFDKNISIGDSMIPEALLCAYLDTDEYIYKDIAKRSFDFLLLKTFSEYPSNSKSRVKTSRKTTDIVHIILALSKFFAYFKEGYYLNKINLAYNRFAEQDHFVPGRVA